LVGRLSFTQKADFSTPLVVCFGTFGTLLYFYNRVSTNNTKNKLGNGSNYCTLLREIDLYYFCKSVVLEIDVIYPAQVTAFARTL